MFFNIVLKFHKLFYIRIRLNRFLGAAFQNSTVLERTYVDLYGFFAKQQHSGNFTFSELLLIIYPRNGSEQYFFCTALTVY